MKPEDTKAADGERPVWLITGCSSGFGREIALAAAGRGACVVVTARDVERVADLASAIGDRALVLALDVTRAEQVGDAVRAAERRFGRIDVLVNNAGRGFAGAIEEASDAEIRALYAVNVFGPIEMARAVLPGMRLRRSGAIVNIGSVGGLVARPGTGIYASTKFAIEGVSQALAAELRPLGIKVMTVEPGPFRTQFLASMDRARARIDDYDATAGARIEQTYAGHGQQPGDPARAARAIVEAIGSDAPPTHLVLGAPALKLVRDELARFGAELDAWESVTLGADFPRE